MPLRPVITQTGLNIILDGFSFYIVISVVSYGRQVPKICGSLLFLSHLEIVQVVIQRHGFRRRTRIFRPCIFSQIGNCNLAFNIIVQNLPCRQICRGSVGYGNFRAPVSGNDPASAVIVCSGFHASTGNTAGKINFTSFCIDILYNKTFRLGIVIHLYNILVSAQVFIIDSPVAFVQFVHRASLHCHFASVVFQFLDIFLTEVFCCNVRHIFTEPALD